MASVRSLSSRWLALTCATAYLVVSAAVGAALLAMPKTNLPPAGSTTTYVSEDRPSTFGDGALTTTLPPTPAGFQRIEGPVRMQTVIPTGWQVVTAGAPGAMRAVDPTDAARLVGYGGAKTTSPDIVQVHVDHEDRFADRATNYERVHLNRATYGGHPAVEWEFRHDDGRGTQRVRALYWLVDGVEYFVFAAGPDEQWARMQPVYDAMVANSRP